MAIKYRTANFYVIEVATGFEVYRDVVGHAVRVARVGHGPNFGLKRAILEADKRQNAIKNN